MTDIESFLEKFTGNQLVLLHTFSISLRDAGIAAEELIEPIEKKILNDISSMSTRIPPSPMARKVLAICPDCGSVCSVSPVNVSKCTAVGGDWKSVLVCENPACRYTEMSTKSMSDWRSNA